MAGQFVDYYDLLGVDPSADHRTIRSAYRRLARRYHPDVAKGRHAARRFLLIREAYEVLADPEKRRQYDKLILRPRLARRSPPQHAAASGVEPAAPAGPAAPRRGFRLVLDVLGILRLDTGIDFGGSPRTTRSPRPSRTPRRTRKREA